MAAPAPGGSSIDYRRVPRRGPTPTSASASSPARRRRRRRRRRRGVGSWPCGAAATRRHDGRLGDAALRRGGGRGRPRPHLRRRLPVLRRRRRRRRSTATTTGGPTCTSPAARARPALFRNDSPIGGALRFERGPEPGDRPRRRSTGAYPLDVDGDGITRPRGAPDRRERRSCAASATAASSARTRRWALDGGDAAGPRRSARPGRARRTLPTLAFGDYLTLDASGDADLRLRRQRRSSGPRAGGTRYAAPIALAPGLVHALDAVQRLGPLGPARPARQNDRHYYTTERRRSSSGGSRPASRRACTPQADGWQTLQIWGMGIASQDLTGDGYPEVYLTSQGDNKLQTLAGGPASRRTATSRSSAALTATEPFTGGDAAAVDRLAPRVRGRQQRRLPRPVRHARATSAESPTTPRRTRANLFLGQPDGTFREGAEAAGILTFARGAGRRARRPQPRRPARPRPGRRGAST